MQRSTPVRTVAIGIAATTVVAMPTLLVGGLAVVIQRDLGFGDTQLGIAIAAAFATGGIVAAPMGHLAERIGPRRTTLLGLASALTALLGIGFLTREWIVLVLFLAMAGVGVTAVQVGVNVVLAGAIPRARQGLAFGAKQAAVPLASLLAGLALPIIGLTLGWQAAFLIAALAIPVVALLMPRASSGGGGRTGDPTRRSAPTGAIVLLAVGVALASAGGNSTPSFLVPSLVDRGIEPATAGFVLAFSSFVGIFARVGGGWTSDRIGRGSLVIVMGMIGAGILGYLGLALTGHVVTLVLSAALAFGGGWGWGGLIPLAISRANPDQPGRAMGIVQVGPMTGAVVGPVLFGALADSLSFTAAWLMVTGLAVAGIIAIAVSRRWFLRAGAGASLRAEGPPVG